LSDISHEPEILRTIVHDEGYVEAVGKIFSSVARADAILEGLEFFISRRADLGMAVKGYPEKEFASWVSKRIPGKGRIRVVYRYDDKTVHMLSAWLIPDEIEGKLAGR
jgi:hypothetical protein